MRRLSPERLRQLREERTNYPWVIFVDGLFYCPAVSYREVRDICDRVRKARPAVLFSQRYEGHNISHMNGGKKYD